jgi:hypothetical protein
MNFNLLPFKMVMSLPKKCQKATVARVETESLTFELKRHPAKHLGVVL